MGLIRVHNSPRLRIPSRFIATLLPTAALMLNGNIGVAHTAKPTRKATLLMFSVALLLVGTAVAVRGQSALDGFDPNANESIRVFVVQPDGKILIGGTFTALSPNGGAAVTRNGIARLNPDGTLDPAFDPNASSGFTIISTIAVQTDGKVLAGGEFKTIGGQPRFSLARLDATTGLADSFDPNPNGFLQSIAVQADGKILVTGSFSTIGGQTRFALARLDPTTGLADSFNPNPDGGIYSIVVQADGKILVGGEFHSIGGQTRNRIARLDPTTGLADSFNPNANDQVDSIAVQADGKVVAGGVFTFVGGQSRSHIARLDATTGLPDPFDPNANGFVLSIAEQQDGKFLLAGNFTSVGGQPRNRIARINPDGTLDAVFNSNANDIAYAIAVQPDGKVLFGGGFTALAPNGGPAVTRNRVARLESDGRLDQTLNLSTVGSLVAATAVQPDGKVLIGGEFAAVLSMKRNNIARLNTDGTLDMVFNPNADAEVDSIAVQDDGKILIGGSFMNIDAQPRNHIARLNSITGLADSFNPNANGKVNSIVVQADGKILVAGAFNGASSIGGQTRNRIARLDPTTGLADSFNPNANDQVSSIAVQADGKILVAGAFNGAISIGGQTRNRIARLDATTGLADSFDPNANGAVQSLAMQADGKILAGGGFTTIGGQTRKRIARLEATTGLADSFNPNANATVQSLAVQADGKILAGGIFNGASSIGGQSRNHIARLNPTTGLADSYNPDADNDLYAITVQPDGKVLAGGNFSSIGGQSRNLFARLSNDTRALQNLTVTQTSITWTRGGSSPLLTRVTIEYSDNDERSYTFLGNGTATGSDWSLTGLNLPTGLNFYIRARGYYRNSYQNGSESLTESVRNAFLTAPLQLTGAVSRKTHGAAGAFDIPLPLTGTPGVECRSGSGTYTLVFTMNNSPVSGNASVTTGIGNVSGSPTFNAYTMTVNLSGVADVQKITVTLSGVTDNFAQVMPDTPVSINMLIGDTTGNKSVNATDVSQTKLRSGSATTGTNFRSDVTLSGSINATDVSQVKSNSGHGVP